MRIQIRHSLLLRKYIIYNLCFVLVPVAILAVVFYGNARKQVIHEYEITHQYTLNQTMDSVDRRLNEFSVIATQIANDSLLTPFQIRSSDYNRIAGLERLRTYYARTDFLGDLILYYTGDDQLYASGGSYSLQTFTESTYDFIGDWNVADFRKLIESKVVFNTSPYQCSLKRKNNETMNNLIVLTYPCPPSSATPYGTIIGLVNQNFFQSLLDTARSDLKSASFILDSQDRILFSTKDSLGVEQADLTNLLKQRSDQAIVRIRINGLDYSAIISRSPQNSWRYVTILPLNQFGRRFWMLQTPLLLVLGVLCLLGIAAGIFLAFKNYQPIHRLDEILNLENGAAKAKNELTNISRAVQDMVSRNRDMSQRLDENRLIIQQRNIQNLLNGTMDQDQSDSRRQTVACGIHLDGPLYCVMVIHLPVRQKPEERENLVLAIQQLAPDKAYALEILYRDLIAVLLNLEQTDEAREQFAVQLSDAVEVLTAMKPDIGVGQLYKKTGQINRSFVEAIAAVETNIQNDNRAIVFFDKLQARKFAGSFWYPHKAQLRLLQALRQGNSKSVAESINELQQAMLSFHLADDSTRLRFMTSSIILQLLPLIEELNLDDSDTDINNLIHYLDLNDFIRLLRIFCQKMTRALEVGKQLERTTLYDQIIAYTNAHYMDQSISLNSIATQFDITLSFLSRFFRDNAGVNFIDYLSLKRMKKACQLLIETDLKIRQIMEQVGYIDLASFTRKFTQLMSISPGRYREENRKTE